MRLALGLLSFLVLLTSGACFSSNDDNLQFYTPYNTFSVVDTNGNPIEGVFWSVSNAPSNNQLTQTSSPKQSPLAYVDNQGVTCPDPDPNTPQVSNGNASAQGCTSSLGLVNVYCESVVSFVINIDDGAGFTASQEAFCPKNFGDSSDIVITSFPTPTEVVIFQSAAVAGDAIGGTAYDVPICEDAAPRAFSEVRALISYTAHGLVDMPAEYGVPAHVPIVTPDGTQIAADWSDLLDGSIAVTLASGGVTGGTNNAFWTGSTSNGLLSAGNNCTDWSVTSGSATVGSALQTDGTWLSNGTVPCTGPLPILCVGF